MENLELIKKLRESSGCGVMEAKKALEETGGDLEASLEILKKRGIEKSQKTEGRQTGQGLIVSYTHSGGRIGSLVLLSCETDFVAHTDDFKGLANEVAMQVVAMNPSSVEQLLDQEYIREPSRKVKDLVVELSGKVGENIVISDFKRLEI